jgi:peptidyl-prolyl cis-trans isomerase A (cyclophilin A)
MLESVKSPLIITLLCILAACGAPAGKEPRVKVETKYGDIIIELYPAKAPKTIAAFLANVDAGNYKNTSFYRILSDENQPSNAPKANLIQGGMWKANYEKSRTLPRVLHETTKQTGILHTNGVVSLARLEPGTGSTEFFICVGDQHGFDYGGANNSDGQGYTAFGKVIKGMDVVRSIYNCPEDEQSFDPPIAIYNIKRL